MKNKILYAVIILALIAVTVAVVKRNFGSGAITAESPTVSGGVFREYSFFSSTTTTAVSTNIIPSFDASGRYNDGSVSVLGAKKAVMYFGRGDTVGTGNTGKTVFSVEGTPDGTNWYAISRMIGSDVSATATSTVTISAATSTVPYALDLTYFDFKAIRCTATETTDGQHTCSVTVEY